MFWLMIGTGGVAALAWLVYRAVDRRYGRRDKDRRDHTEPGL